MKKKNKIDFLEIYLSIRKSSIPPSKIKPSGKIYKRNGRRRNEEF